MKKERYTREQLSGLCDEYAEQCFFCPAMGDCPMSDFAERKVEESKMFPFIEEMIYGKVLPIS